MTRRQPLILWRLEEMRTRAPRQQTFRSDLRILEGTSEMYCQLTTKHTYRQLELSRFAGHFLILSGERQGIKRVARRETRLSCLLHSA